MPYRSHDLLQEQKQKKKKREKGKGRGGVGNLETSQNQFPKSGINTRVRCAAHRRVMWPYVHFGCCVYNKRSPSHRFQCILEWTVQSQILPNASNVYQTRSSNGTHASDPESLRKRPKLVSAPTETVRDSPPSLCLSR